MKNIVASVVSRNFFGAPFCLDLKIQLVFRVGFMELFESKLLRTPKILLETASAVEVL